MANIFHFQVAPSKLTYSGCDRGRDIIDIKYVDMYAQYEPQCGLRCKSLPKARLICYKSGDELPGKELAKERGGATAQLNKVYAYYSGHGETSHEQLLRIPSVLTEDGLLYSHDT